MTGLEKLAFEQLKGAMTLMNAAVHDIKNAVEYQKDMEGLLCCLRVGLDHYHKGYNKYHEIIKAFES